MAHVGFSLDNKLTQTACIRVLSVEFQGHKPLNPSSLNLLNRKP